MDIYLARQPILDINKKIVAYELLYRGESLTMDLEDGNVATIDVINNTLINVGFEEVVVTGRAFFNFTGDLIKKEIPKIFDKDKVVIEILEDVVPDAELIEKIKELKKIGYIIALDDFVLEYEYDELLELADIVKVDFMLTDKIERMKVVYKLNKYKVQILAEKVETLEEFEEAKKLGCMYFQGYFFEKPEIIKSKAVKHFSTVHIDVIQELSKDEPEYDKIIELVKQDFAMVYKFLKLVNSVAFYSRTKVDSVERALVNLGFTEINKYVYLLMLQDISNESLDVLIETALVRAKFAEIIAKNSKFKKDSNSFFLVGMFSLIDALTNESKEESLEKLPIIDEIKNAIIGTEENQYSVVLRILEYHEKGKFDLIDIEIEALEIKKDVIKSAYIEAIKWKNKINLKSI